MTIGRPEPILPEYMLGDSRYTVLIVSDAQAGAGLEPSFLRRPNIRVMHVTDPSVALDRLGQLRPDLIIEDLAGEASSRRRRRRPSLPCARSSSA